MMINKIKKNLEESKIEGKKPASIVKATTND
jgi:hypothetical protein